MSLLYDRDDGGEYLHAYTDPFDDRFFFEVVERIGDYRGYGAVNAAVRMAAQSQRRRAPIAALLRAGTAPGGPQPA
jgi:4-hydroxyphenylpyruvate dioxygenase